MAWPNVVESTGALAAGAANALLKSLDAKGTPPRIKLWSRWQNWGKVAYPVAGAVGVMTNTMTQMSNGVYLAGIPMLMELLSDALGLTSAAGAGARGAERYVQAARPQARYVSPAPSMPTMVSSTPAPGRVGYVPGGLPERPQLGR